MTVIVSKPAVNLREELASLRNQGGYQEQQFYFDGLVTNGTFDTDTSGWTANRGSISWSSGQIVVASNGSDYGAGVTAVNLTQGATYYVAVQVGDAPVASPDLWIGTTWSNASALNASGMTANSLYSNTFVAGASTMYVTLLALNVGVNTVKYDNVMIFETDANDDVVHRMPKGWVPKDVYEDGLLQREGSAHDYEVVYDGFDYYVKPTVAPSATTQTCVIGVKA
jgi:hypothetical protein